MDSYFAAKMADRVTCDICNKQVCNKYFLKTHKLKVHGCADTSSISSGGNGSGGMGGSGGAGNSSQMMDNDGDYDMNEYELNEMNEMNQKLMNDEDNNNSEYESHNNNNEFNKSENMMMMMDDEDQQSKDNLKHIKFLNQLRATSGSPNSALAQIFNKSTLAAMGIDPNTNAAALAALAASLNYSQGLNNSNNNNLSSNNQSSKPKPPALARVSCQICRKELCNKYFLKSHLLNAHHINADEFFMNSLNDLPQQQQSEKLFSELNKKFNIFNNNANESTNQQSQRQTQSPTASMRSTSSVYNANGNSNKVKVSTKTNGSNHTDNEIEEGQQVDEDNQQNNSDEEDEQNNANNAAAAMLANHMSFNALLNYNKIMNTNNNNGVTNPLIGSGNPIDNNNSSCNNMQPFLFECQDESFNSNFVPCMVYLPVKSKLDSSITLKVTLKPLDNIIGTTATNESSSLAANARSGASENEEGEETSD